MNLQAQLYGDKFATKPVDTRVIRTDNGNYVYSHWFNGNNFQGSRVLLSTSGEDKKCDNPGQFMHLKYVCKLAEREKIFSGCHSGAEIERLYNQ